MKTRLELLLELLESIDDEYGFGPNEEICDENKVDLYIQNFIDYAKRIKIYDEYMTHICEGESKSVVEKLYEI